MAAPTVEPLLDQVPSIRPYIQPRPAALPANAYWIHAPDDVVWVQFPSTPYWPACILDFDAVTTQFTVVFAFDKRKQISRCRPPTIRPFHLAPPPIGKVSKPTKADAKRYLPIVEAAVETYHSTITPTSYPQMIALARGDEITFSHPDVTESFVTARIKSVRAYIDAQGSGQILTLSVIRGPTNPFVLMSDHTISVKQPRYDFTPSPPPVIPQSLPQSQPVTKAEPQSPLTPQTQQHDATTVSTNGIVPVTDQISPPQSSTTPPSTIPAEPVLDLPPIPVVVGTSQLRKFAFVPTPPHTSEADLQRSVEEEQQWYRQVYADEFMHYYNLYRDVQQLPTTHAADDHRAGVTTTRRAHMNEDTDEEDDSAHNASHHELSTTKTNTSDGIASANGTAEIQSHAITATRSDVVASGNKKRKTTDHTSSQKSGAPVTLTSNGPTVTKKAKTTGGTNTVPPATSSSAKNKPKTATSSATTGKAATKTAVVNAVNAANAANGERKQRKVLEEIRDILADIRADFADRFDLLLYQMERMRNHEPSIIDELNDDRRRQSEMNNVTMTDQTNDEAPPNT